MTIHSLSQSNSNSCHNKLLEEDNYADDNLEQPYYITPPISHSKKWYFTALLALIVGLCCGTLLGRYVTLFDADRNHLSSKGKLLYSSNVKDDVISEIKAENIRNNLKILTSKPHVAGSEQNEEYLVNFIKDRWESYLDAVEVFPYDVLLSFPNETDKNYVGITFPNGSITQKSTPDEKPVTEDEKNATIISAFNAYSPGGHVEGNMFYVNYGREEDFMQLAERGINVNGSICIARYGQVYRGDKAKFAQEYNCTALILYSDPHDEANVPIHGWDPNTTVSVYPNSWWLPPTGFQRGSLLDQNGDPLTPDYPSLNFTYRIPRNEINAPTIPVLPISYKDAYQYLSILNGTDAPEDWQGGFKTNYKFGGSFVESHSDCKAVVHVANYMQRKVVKTVIGYIRGALEPDRYVIIGNHRDAWTFGGADPSSGTAVVLELSRAIAKVVNDGKWRPRRTIIFCSWAAEEFAEIGSTEWVEQMEKRLLMQAVSYFNIDVAVGGNVTFMALSTPNFNQLLFDITKSIKNPSSDEIAQGRSTVYDTWLYNTPDPNHPQLPFINGIGSGSDFVGFLQKAGVACFDIGYVYVPGYPVYHSLHDTFEYFEKFIDPEFNVSVAVASVAADSILQLSSSLTLPMNPIDTAVKLNFMATNLHDKYKSIFEKNVSLDELFRVIKVFNESAIELMEQVKELNESSSEIHVRMINDKLFMISRGFLDFNGLPGRHYYRNVVFAPSSFNSYDGAGYPAVNDAAIGAERGGSLDKVREELSVLCVEILSAAQLMRDF